MNPNHEPYPCTLTLTLTLTICRDPRQETLSRKQCLAAVHVSRRKRKSLANEYDEMVSGGPCTIAVTLIINPNAGSR